VTLPGLSRKGVERMSKEGIFEVGYIQKLNHNPQPCRYCEYVFEHPCCGSGLEQCPNCGTYVKRPLNAD
jgi:hypothetical protein